MSLLRLAFWLALIVMLLPQDAAQQARFTSFAGAALERLGGFCDRNSRTCSAGSEAWSVFLRKAEFGMRLVGDLLGAGTGRRPEPGPDMPPGAAPGKPYYGPSYGPSYGRPDPRGTLQPQDLYAPPWRGPKAPRGYY